MKNYMHIIRYRATILIGSLVLWPLLAFSQSKITGVVKDRNNQAMPGVNVILLNTNLGTTTSAEGEFSLEVPNNPDNALVFSFIGYNSDTVRLYNKTHITVTLTEAATEIESLVVVGYGSMRKSDVTGSVASVKINEFEANSVTSFDKLIQGRVAGVQVTSGNAAPGGAVEIKIRGTSSFNSSSEPLYVVDGVILNPASQDVRSSFTSGVNYQESQNPLSTIDPNDILSMEILKDASATAIYGSQGANGVVLITTKSGTTAKPRVEYRSTVQISQPSKKIPMLDLYGYAAWRDEIDNNRIDPDTCVAVNWQDYAMHTAISQSHRISVSGKTETTNYYVSGSFSDNNGVIKNTNVQTGNMRINLDKTVEKWFKIGMKSNFNFTLNNMTQGADPNGTLEHSMMKQILNSKPFFTKTNVTSSETGDEEEVLEGPQTWFDGYEDRSREFRIIPMVYADLSLFKWLSFKTTVGADYRRKTRARSYSKILYAGAQVGGKAGVSTLQSFRYNVDNMFNLNFNIGKYHKLSGVAGMTLNVTTVENSAVENQQFPTMDWGADGLIIGTSPLKESFGETRTALVSFLARGIYSYKDKYILTATIRADGSSKFSKENAFAWFPSFAFAWRVTEEKFMKSVNAISNLKLRAGWGRVGNQSLSPYQTLATYSTQRYATIEPSGIEIGYLPDNIPNRMLKWETSEQINLGLDLSFFHNRLNITTDIYSKNTKDLLQQIKLPGSAGYSTMWVNRGCIQNRGLEISVDGIIIDKPNFSWSLGGNISFNRNKISDSAMELAQYGVNSWRAFYGNNVANSTYLKKPANIFIEGKPVALFYGLKTNGIIQSDTDPSLIPTFYGSDILKPGSVFFVDQDGDMNITDDDFVIIGDPNPKFSGGFFMNFTYKNLSLDLNFNGVYGNDVLNGNLVMENQVDFSNTKNIRADAYYKAWRPDAPSNEYPALGQYPSTVEISDRYIEDGSFLRLSNISLSYRFKIKKIDWIKSIDVSVSGRNLFLLSNYSGWDPEVNSFAYDPLRVGIDWGSYPNYRAIIFGLGFVF